MGSRVLFLTNSELGQASHCLAIAHELLHQPGFSVHIASFEPLREKVYQLNARAAVFGSQTGQQVTTARFHPINGMSMRQALEQRRSFNPAHAFQIHGLGYEAAIKAYRNVLVRAMVPWTGEEYMVMYRGCEDVVDGVDAALIVVDPLFTQAIDVCRHLGKKYVILSPNTFKEHVPQPWLANAWKYPMICSGYPYPLPKNLIFKNTMLALRFLITYKTDRLVRDVEKFRKANGISGPIPDMTIDSNDEDILAVILASRMEYEYPCILPPKFVLCGPIIRPFAPIAEEHPGLARWLARCPTVLVNLGSIAQFSPIIEREFARAVRSILEVRGSAQVLWKLPRSASATSPPGVITDPMALEILSFFMEQDRLRTMTWLPVEPSCLLQSGHVKCVVHHGGANSYHEAIRAGIPQVIAPIWFGTFDFAQRVEYLGIGYWGNQLYAPNVCGPELGQAVKRILFTERGRKVAQRAREVASKVGPREGRVVACEKIMRLTPSRLD